MIETWGPRLPSLEELVPPAPSDSFIGWKLELDRLIGRLDWLFAEAEKRAPYAVTTDLRRTEVAELKAAWVKVKRQWQTEPQGG